MTRIYPLRDNNKTPIVCECTHSINDHNDNAVNSNMDCFICQCPMFDEMVLNYTEQDMMK